MKVYTLTKEVAEQNIDELLELHNLIPFQNWTEKDLLKEEDSERIFKDKWKLSSVCTNDNKFIGACFAFINNQTQILENDNFLYLHRIAVLPEYRFRGIGSKMIKYTCQEFYKIYPENKSSGIIVSTPIKSTNSYNFENAEPFYLKLGFEKIGEKQYDLKLDSILKTTVSQLIQ